ncbi:hypothetical protein HDE69_003904 [Pedobacter cryoconitis]|uniref:Lipoprotein n=1 Tax=Pedobacter cryoconitis TaxID=188932 RepID=A0A7W9DL17_9SPHI|nr:hypothetical protein [Pedobacter cryoconitis]MBB5622822.1 hypothetical protein [Pedobacter cryoconitis]
MKKIKLNRRLSITFSLLVFICLSSCSKQNADRSDSSEKYLTCKLNGKDYSFNTSVNANDKPAEDEVHFVVIGGWEKEDRITGFGIDMVIPEGVKEKTYSVAGTSAPELKGQFYIQNYKDGKHMGTTVYEGGRSPGTQFTLTITSLTDWGVKGTFSGKLELRDGNEFITVTEGKFSAPYNGN